MKHCISMRTLWMSSGNSMILGDADASSMLNMIMIKARYVQLARSLFLSEYLVPSHKIFNRFVIPGVYIALLFES